MIWSNLSNSHLWKSSYSNCYWVLDSSSCSSYFTRSSNFSS